MTRTERQLVCENKWRDGGGRASLECCTGFGKTRVAINIFKRMVAKRPELNAIIVVPTIPLRIQWEEIVEKEGLSDNSTIYVINTIILAPVIVSCDLLILDEIHKYAADTFYSVFDIVAYKFVLGLTATLERMDGKHKLLEQFCPIIDTVTLLEARRNGWVSDYVEYNLSVTMNEEDQTKYDNINNWLNKVFAIFHHDYYKALDCTSSKNRFFNGKMQYGAEHFINTHVKVYGEPCVLYDYQGVQLHGQSLVNEVVKQANNTTRLIREREHFLSNNDTKIEVAKEIIETLNMKTVTFGKSTECADKLTELLGLRAASYHSYLESEIREVEEVKTFKTLKSAEAFAFTNNSIPIKEEEKLYTVTYTKSTKYGKDRLKKEVIIRLENNEISVVNTAKALDLGLDVSDMQLAIIIAGDSNPTTQTQRKGRVIRKEGDKVAIIVNIILKGTQDEKWCRNRQKGCVVRNIENIKDITI